MVLGMGPCCLMLEIEATYCVKGAYPQREEEMAYHLALAPSVTKKKKSDSARSLVAY